jgi:transposase
VEVEVKRIDHLGIVAGIIKDLDIAKLIDEAFGIDKQEAISTGEAVVGMILNGLGFTTKPLMLTPQFFENKALGLLIKEGAKPEQFNRHKLGRVLDAIAKFGCEKLFNTLALSVCKKEDVNMKFAHGDTTTYSLSGEYDVDSDTHTIKIKHGHSKDRRPDLKQVVLELVTSQDGGIPFISKAFDGNTSDSIILRERAKMLIEDFRKTGSQCFVADSKLYCQETAESLNKINFITRVPGTLKTVVACIANALTQPNNWEIGRDGYRFQEFSSSQYNIEQQRWIVVYSDKARERSIKTLNKEVEKEKERTKKELFHLQAARFACEDDAHKALNLISKKLSYHQISDIKVLPIKIYTKRGRPIAEDSQEFCYQIKAVAIFDQAAFDLELDHRSCFVLATNISQQILSTEQVLVEYKGQDKTEKSFAFIKSPEFFTSSLFLKKPARIEALLMIMMLALLVYSIAQRRLRNQLKALQQTLPNQINKPTATPTMRWIFQLFEGVNQVTIISNTIVSVIIEGITELRKKILSFFSPNIQKIYQFQNFGTGG